MSTGSSAVAEQRVVLITGASSGIGQACAVHLARRGWRVFGTARRPEQGGAAAEGVEMIAMDVDDDASVRAGVAAVLGKTGRLDAVVNNAGISVMGSIEDTSDEEARAQLETNFFGVHRVCRAVLPVMRGQRRGHIVNISSLAGLVGLPFNGFYCASKFALEGMTEALRHETRQFGVQVVLVEPGDFRTGMVQRRRVAAAALEHEPYAALSRRFKDQQDNDEAKAPTPEPVARLVERILNNPRPKMRYTVGMWIQRFLVALKRVLPQWGYEWLVRTVVGI